MKITFLEARVPLTKKITAEGKEPYPNAFEFKTHTHDVSSTKEFCQLVKTHAALGHALLKGEIQKELDWESRAGSTDAATYTEHLCLDIDGMSSVTSVKHFMAMIGLADVEHFYQFSASYGINNDFKLSAHVFLRTTPVSPEYVKIWLKHVNLKIFAEELKLTKTSLALRWGLDITTCQNDKILYITPPDAPDEICFFKGERIVYVDGPKDRVDFTQLEVPNTSAVKELEQQAINDLRVKEGLPKKRVTQFRLKEQDGELYMPNPDECAITGVKQERGFVYFNLNGGDSWGYFHPEDNYKFIYNFKGEPAYKTSELLPSYYKERAKAEKEEIRKQHKAKLFLAFRDYRTAEYYNGWYDQGTDTLTLARAKSERQLEDFMLTYGQAVPEAVPIWNITYDPELPVLDPTQLTVNTFKRSELMKWAEKSKHVTPKPTPTIDRIIQHAVGPDEFLRFFNWIAYCFQYKLAPRTAWILHGTQGTGKGFLFHKILRPLFGDTNCVQKRMVELEDKFNEHLEQVLLCNIDEAHINDSARTNMLMADLKNQITEPVITIRRMRQSAYEVKNRVGFLFFSNKPDPVVIEANDRRFNVGTYQRESIVITDDDIKAIDQELPHFALRLVQHKVDMRSVRTPANNAAKIEMQATSRTSADVVADAIKSGNLELLWDAMPSDHNSATTTGFGGQIPAQKYVDLIYDLVRSRRDRLTRDELYVLFEYNVGKVPNTPTKFTQYLKHKGLEIRRVRFNERTVAGVADIEWTNDKEWFEERLEEMDNIKVKLDSGSVVKGVAADEPKLDMEALNLQQYFE